MSLAPEILKIEGALTFTNLPRILEQTSEFESRADLPDAVAIDLSGISEVDSSAVALLLKWRREALRLHRHLDIINIPENLSSLVELYDVLDIIQAKPK